MSDRLKRGAAVGPAMVQTPESRQFGKLFIGFGLAVIALGIIIFTSLFLMGPEGTSFDYHYVEYASLAMVGLATVPLVLVMFGQAAR